MNFRVKEELMLWIPWSKRKPFSTQEVGRKMIFPQYLRGLHDILRNGKYNISVLKKKTKNGKMIFSLAWNIMM